MIDLLNLQTLTSYVCGKQNRHFFTLSFFKHLILELMVCHNESEFTLPGTNIIRF